MKRLLLTLTIVTTILFQAHSSEVLKGREADKAVPGAEMVWLKDATRVPAFIKFRQDERISFTSWQDWMAERYFKDQTHIGFEFVSETSDKLGMTHYRYKQTADGKKVTLGTWIVHTMNGQVVSMNGLLFDDITVLSSAINEAQALSTALNYIGGEVYKWQIPAEEAAIKEITNDPNATYYPEGELEYVNSDASVKTTDLHLAWRFDIYSSQPLARKNVFVDAITGNVVDAYDLIHEADSNITAVTGYVDTQNIVADWTGSVMRLRETGRGNGIITLDMNNGTSGAGVDFTHPDNFWDETSLHRFGTDAHFGTESTYDYYYNHFNRNSIDDNGFILRSRVHYGNNFANAFWDGQFMTYGDGNNGNSPFTALDVCGHEVTHGLTSNTANLIYQAESGALNESFSDVFAAAIEYDALGPNSGEWLIGEDLNFLIRNMSNPNVLGDPDTYFGSFWASLTGGDNGGVHTNSGVQNYWFYLLTEGGAGTNDNGDSYNVTGIGIEDAAAIAYRNLTVYLMESSQYEDARLYGIQSAVDLFGACGQEAASTWEAWYAVGVGDPYTGGIETDFIANHEEHCASPATVDFTNHTLLASTYSWNFGDGNTSTAYSPTHTYQTDGVYTVTLIASSTCDADTLVFTDYIKVGPSYPCNVSFPANGGLGQTQTGCEGYLFDNGGPNEPYTANYVGSMTIAPTGAVSVTLEFIEFDVEADPSCQYDYLTVYDGPSTASPILGTYCNGNNPPTFLTSTGSSITVAFTSDVALEEDGFEIGWECNIPSEDPIADFEADLTETCEGTIHFTDLSAVGNNVATGWYWEFGDGATDTVQNPTHTYTTSGTYTVLMVAINPIGTDTVIKTNYIDVSKPIAPVGDDVEVCPGDAADLIASSAGTNYWYDSPTSTNVLHVGDTFTTPIVQQSTPFYVESVEFGPAQQGGKADNSGGGGYFQFFQSIFFDAFATFNLSSVTVYASTPGDRDIVVYDQFGTVVHDTTMWVATGEQQLDLNWVFEPGTDYEFTLAAGSTTNLYRNNAGVNYPYEIPGVVSVTRSSAGTDPYGYYYFFYNWEVQDICISDRGMISASTGECTGVDEIGNSEFEVYPNPSNGQFTLTWNDQVRPDMINIYDASGSLVSGLTTNSTQNRLDLDLSDLASGIYLLKGSNGIIAERIVIE